MSRRLSVYPFSEPEYVKGLLSRGEDPNLKYENFKRREETPWIIVLKLVREALRRNWIEADGDNKKWVEIIRLFIEGGADVNVVIADDGMDPEIEGKGVIDSVLDKFEIEDLRVVRAMMGT